MVRTRQRQRYDSPKWQKKFRDLAAKGGKNALKELGRSAYVAFRRRFDAEKWKTNKRRGPKGILPETARPGRRQLYTNPQIIRIMKKAKGMVSRRGAETVRRWHPVSKALNHLKGLAREAFAEAAWRLRETPAHLKALAKPYEPSRVWFKKVTTANFKAAKHVRETMKTCWKELKDAIETNEVRYRELK